LPSDRDCRYGSDYDTRKLRTLGRGFRTLYPRPRVRLGRTLLVAGPSCPGYHGFASSGIRYELVVPPRSFSEIVAPFEVSPTPPWVDSDFRMTWTAENSTRTSAPPTLEREQVVRSPRPPVVRNAPRRTGVGLHIILERSRAAPPSGTCGPAVSRAGGPSWSTAARSRPSPETG